MVYEDLKDYVNAWLGYEDEKRQTREAKNDFKDSFMAKTGATKQEIQMLEKALSINKKLETDNEITDFVDKVEKIAQFLKKMAPGSENVDEKVSDRVSVCAPPNEQMTLDVVVDGAAASTAAPFPVTVTTTSSTPKTMWNPHPGPRIPADKPKKAKL